MNILFLTMSNFESIQEHSLYPDLIREFASRGHLITVLSPIERKMGMSTYVIKEGNVCSIKVRTGNLFNVGIIEKTISRAGVCFRYKRAIRKYCNGEKFNLVLYSTPPTTLTPIVRTIKKRGAYSYLMLKDIFPQNAVDLGMIGQKSLVYKYFRCGEKRIYRESDTIGCMSPANVEYLLHQDPWLDPQKITLCPNAIEVRDLTFSETKKQEILAKYAIPNDRLLFVYGGGLGKPQGIPFFEKCIRAVSKDKELFFVVIGDGCFFNDLKQLEKELPNSLKVIKWLPSKEYETIVQACSVGVVMLNHNFKIPNFPSRVLLYMQAHLPIIAATDPSTDIGRIAEENQFGVWCESNNVSHFVEKVLFLKDARKRQCMGNNAYQFLLKNYSVNVIADSIIERAEQQ